MSTIVSFLVAIEKSAGLFMFLRLWWLCAVWVYTQLKVDPEKQIQVACCGTATSKETE